ncbi:hypothetical protein QOZ80_6BG0492320 [Eleusine coracana subsp. coracana]|nr:hypothetical protein QOZ80_6BG0492320 [Eleusine coracana subsp. coracana]
MLNEGILSDILVNAGDGGGDSIRAHRAVLAARSPVFMSMFSHDLKEKEQSVVDIPDMSFDACRAFIRYIYGSLSCEEFIAHRSELLAAGDKFDVSGLKETCKRSMVEDIDTDSVLERLQIAHLFGLSELKRASTDEQKLIKYLCGALDKIITFYQELMTDLPLKADDGFTWTVDCFVTVRFITEVKLLDLKIADRSYGDPVSIWPPVSLKLQDTCSEFASMLQGDIPTDITISTSNGSIKAHSSVLAARSPVFQSMFAHNLKERQHSTIDISDMSFDECQAFVSFMYNNVEESEFIPHRIALFGAAEKYDVSELKSACLENLMQDLDTENLIERLQMAHLYQLPELKKTCVSLLLDFGKFYEVMDDFVELIKTDSDLGSEIVREMLCRSTGFDS